MNYKKVSMNDIAKKLGISVVSVSKAMNSQNGISDDLRRRIMDTAHDLGYIAQGKKLNGEMLKFAYFVPRRYAFESEQFYTLLFYHLNEICAQNSVALNLFIIGDEEEKRNAVPAIMGTIGFDGIFLGGEILAEYIRTLYQYGIPIICIDFYKPAIDMDCVIVDNYYASFRAADYLVQNGHKKIGFLSHPDLTSSITDRLFGYQSAMFQYCLPVNMEWILPISNGITLPSAMPTAFVCHNDTSAIQFMRILSKFGLSVPSDVSLIGFDNLEIGAGSEPALTSVDVDRMAFARKAYALMMDRIKNRTLPVQRVYVETSIVKRSSVKELR